jgi:hypothetical protein
LAENRAPTHRLSGNGETKVPTDNAAAQKVIAPADAAPATGKKTGRLQAGGFHIFKLKMSRCDLTDSECRVIKPLLAKPRGETRVENA